MPMVPCYIELTITPQFFQNDLCYFEMDDTEITVRVTAYGKDSVDWHLTSIGMWAKKYVSHNVHKDELLDISKGLVFDLVKSYVLSDTDYIRDLILEKMEDE